MLKKSLESEKKTDADIDEDVVEEYFTEDDDWELRSYEDLLFYCYVVSVLGHSLFSKSWLLFSYTKPWALFTIRN